MPAVAAATMFEVWMHHDDLTRANDLAHHTPDHLAEAIPFLRRYQADRLPSARLIFRTTDNHEFTCRPNVGAPPPRPTASQIYSCTSRGGTGKHCTETDSVHHV
jgi:hypothetical protein